MKVRCCICTKDLKKPGALVFGPPWKGEDKKLICSTNKYHVCEKCWGELYFWLFMTMARKTGIRKPKKIVSVALENLVTGVIESFFIHLSDLGYVKEHVMDQYMKNSKKSKFQISSTLIDLIEEDSKRYKK
jgi:hypothetical protein